MDSRNGETGPYQVSMPLNQLYLLLRLWFTDTGPSLSNPIGFGNAYEVDYVRVWRFK
jgi:hypothetical protein